MEFCGVAGRLQVNITAIDDSPSRPVAKWELSAVVLVVCLALVLGLTNAGVPSLWHDEAVHVYVAKSMAETGRAVLRSGEPYQNAYVYHAILAAFISLFGDGEAAVRLPSAIFHAVNVALLFVLARNLLGPWPAFVAALFLAVSPWTVAWAREARFYTFQQTIYLAMLVMVWGALHDKGKVSAIVHGVFAAILFFLGVLTSMHSFLFLTGVGIYGLAILAIERRWRSRALVLCVVVGVVSVAGIAAFAVLLTPKDAQLVFQTASVGGELRDHLRQDKNYYLQWLRDNLSRGYYYLTLFGIAAMVYRERRRGLFAALAFAVPVLILTVFIGYRRPRFMFFAFPLYVAAYSYGLVALARFLPTMRQSWWRFAAGLLILAFGARLAWSTVKLLGDTLETASGAHVTLARRHPQWRGPAQYVKERMAGAVVVTTTFMPVYYYTGRVDNWYPNRYFLGERFEAGMEGLATVHELADYVSAHPAGYFLAEWWRFHRNSEAMANDIAWVEENLVRIDEASSEDVTVWAWGVDE